MSQQCFPDSCCFRDIRTMVTGGQTSKWDPTKMKLVKTCFCETHKKQCPVSFKREDVALMGAPCVLWSAYGKREGFQNKEKKKCHDAGTVFQRRVDLSLHENVVGYDELRHLTAFRNEMPHRELYDLSANVKKRRRTEKADRGLPCLTTSSQLWSENEKRLFLAKEQMFALGFPSVPAAASSGGVVS
ncbi:unnamed protein product [Durusdinium trenchii]|uniref:Uncharacterized protein n=1 Tax=Durusdinium trenchii TaxID=1381693 RepID=A0ABP0SM33_9DINO